MGLLAEYTHPFHVAPPPASRLAEVHARVDASIAKLLLDTKELVVLGEALRPARRARLDLAGAKADHQIRDEGVLRLPGAVRHHDSPALVLAHLASLDRLRNRPDLVHLQEERIARLLLDGRGDTLRVGHKQVVTDDLRLLADLRLESRVRLPVVLVEGVLDGHERVVVDPVLVVGDHLLTRLLHLRSGILVLEVQVVLLDVRFPELRSGDVSAKLHLVFVARLLNGLHQNVESLVVVLHRDREATLIAHVASILAILLLRDGLQVMVDLRADLHGLLEGAGANRQDHELLACEAVAGVGPTVDDVEARDRHHVLIRGLARKFSDVLVEGHRLGGGARACDGGGCRR